MKLIACGECRQTSAMNDAFSVLDRQLCRPCAETALAQHGEEQLPENAVNRLVDPTVCAQCGTDNGDNELPTISTLPVCLACEESFRNRPYPLWLKLAFVALLGLAMFSFVWNWRFLAAYREMQQMKRALDSSRWEEAAALAEAAAQHVPEDAELVAAANFSRGVALLANEQAAQAVAAFQKARQGQHMGPVLDRMLIQAEAAAAFDAKDYDTFLAKTEAYATAFPADKLAKAGIASAYACKYAVGGAEEDREQALEHLDEAAKLAGPADPDFQEYRERIEHRLETREIISHKEFHRRFPSGYQKEVKL